MRAIKSKNTKPELLIRKRLHAAGFRFRLHKAGLSGKPDIVLTKYRAVIFVHGCFWHGHDCRYFKLPSTRTEFWLGKINSNRERDLYQITSLLKQGWRVLVIWECTTRKNENGSFDILFDQVKNWLITGDCATQLSLNGPAGITI
jgi:DNA mismatch endonuclease (patch repair protein)